MWNYHRQAAAASLFLNSVDLSFWIEVKSDVIKDINFATVCVAFATVEVLVERTFFAFSPLICLLVGSQGCSMFFLELIID